MSNDPLPRPRTETAGTLLLQVGVGELMECRDCNHRRHKPGECKNCNCGQSEISTLTAPVRPDELHFRRESYMPKTLVPGVNCGHRVKAYRVKD